MQRRHLIATTGALLAAPAVQAQPAWPGRGPIRVIVPFTPGGATDGMARVTTGKLQEKLGQTFIVENRAGANGAVGGQFVAQSAPDGYTFCFSASIQILARLVMRNPGYDPVADLLPIIRVGQGPLLLIMNGQRPQTNLAELVAAMRANPRDWSFAVSSLGAAGHLATIEFIRQVGADIVQVPYRGTAPAITDVVAGTTQLMFDPILATLPQVRGGRVKGMAITAAARSAAAPEIPTAQEAGMPGLDIQSWWGLWGPRGVPAEIVARIGEVLRTGMFEADVLARVATLGIEPLAQPSAEFSAFIQRDVARAQDLLRIANFQPE
ncbi:tripartite tricarboxylate transporter substrate binding protein [Sediminicoccus sp. KRV36]|uniref:Bug family tripartite tricarboxylate transporter substrate binding protein n=1 Tax=Sediminicoccus sp. KRV36 TaxID=3133721 RepID=UPI00200DB5C8|nr:tripartite tricarboxylate transporter substrate binding protein [Sediminicoccus rosea]UPY36659.1 tripartite tricarboxylate transporter substrate binding protein [Sediminicoccus rosea]